MTESFFQQIAVPVANWDDVATSPTVLFTYVERPDCTGIAVHGIETTTGALGDASVGQREQRAAGIFSTGTAELDNVAALFETHLRNGVDTAASVIETAQDSIASVFGFTPHVGSSWHKPVMGEGIRELIGNRDVPTLVLSDRTVTEA